MLWSKDNTFLIIQSKMICGNKTFGKLQQVTDQGDDYTTGCPPYYPCFKENYNLRVIDDIKLRFSKQKVLDADPEAKQQVHFTRNLNRQDK